MGWWICRPWLAASLCLPTSSARVKEVGAGKLLLPQPTERTVETEGEVVVRGYSVSAAQLGPGFGYFGTWSGIPSTLSGAIESSILGSNGGIAGIFQWQDVIFELRT